MVNVKLEEREVKLNAALEGNDRQKIGILAQQVSNLQELLIVDKKRLADCAFAMD